MALTKVTGQVIKNTTDVTVGVLTVTNTLAVGGTVSIGGTLTYEDVTNVDAVGLITARDGIKVGSGITLSVDGDGFFTGVITATSYSGIDLSDVTGATGDFSIADKIVHTGDTNTTIRFPAADTITAETGGSERLRIDSSGRLLLGTTTSAAHANADDIVIAKAGKVGLTLNSTDSDASHIYFADSSSNPGTYAGYFEFNHGTDTLKYGTGNDQRFQVDSSGRFMIGTTTEGVSNADDLTIATSGNTGLSIRSGTSSQGNIFFSDGTSGADEYRGYFQYLHATNALLIGTDGSERARLTSEGKLGINISSPVTIIHANGNSTVGTSVTMTLQSHDTANSTAGIDLLARDNSNNNETCRVIAASGGAETVSLQFHTNDAEKMRITNDGKVGIGDASPDALLVIKGDSDSATTPSIRLKDGSDTREAWITNNSGDLMLVNGGDDNTPHCKITLLDGNLMTFATANTERMRITSSGSVNIATASDTGIYLNVNQPNATGGHSVHLKAGASSSYSSAFACRVTCHGFYTNSYNNGGILFVNEDDTSHNRNAQAARFLNNDGTNVGAVLFNTSSTSYSTSSDYRLKENETPISDAITRLKTLKPYRFNFKATPSETIDGFFAHEVTTVPNAITGTKDQVDSDGNPLYQSMDHAKLVPLLTAALQEAVARIEALEG